MGQFTEHLTKMVNAASELPDEIDALLRLGADEGFRCLAIEEHHPNTNAVTGFTLWLCEHTRPQMSGVGSFGNPRHKHHLTMAKVVAAKLSIWQLRRMQQRIKGMSKKHMVPGDKLQLTIWRGEPFNTEKHGAPSMLRDSDAREAIVVDSNGAELLWVLWPINPDARRTGL